ncbi:MAG: ester cyclase [Acidimicrobiia bacterium]
MANNAERAATLVRALEASVAGDSSIVSEVFTDDVRGEAPTMTVSSAAELAVELEDRHDAFSAVELAVSPLDVGGDRAAVEWVVTLAHTGPVEIRDVVLRPTGATVTLHGMTVADFSGSRICSFRQYWDEAELLGQLAAVGEE